MTRVIRLAAAAAAVALVGAACDDSGGFDKEAFCKIATEFNEQEGAPTPEQLDEYIAAAPDDIKADAEFVADKIKQADGDMGSVFGDPEVGEKISRFEEAETRECGLHQDDEGNNEEGGDEPVTEPAEGAAVVEITAVEYAFEGVPETVPAGSTALGFSNEGDAAHELVVFRLVDGKTLDDFLSLEGEDDPRVDEIVDEEVGGTFSEPGGEVTYANLELAPGTYVLACFVPGPEGKSHAEHGMTAQFTVA